MRPTEHRFAGKKRLDLGIVIEWTVRVVEHLLVVASSGGIQYGSHDKSPR